MEQNTETVLIVEDDKYITNFISMSLKNEGYHALTAATGQEALQLDYANNPDLVILDLGLPDMDGQKLISQIRQYSDKPILVVSARQEEQEKIKALDLGADDYMTKPFYMGELLARIRAAKRKRGGIGAAGSEPVFQWDSLTVDFEKHLVFVDGEEIHLTPYEYKLLRLLIQNRGKVLTHQYILHEIWGYSEVDNSRSLRVFMTTLRRKIEKDPSNPRFILTEIGVGYRFAN